MWCILPKLGNTPMLLLLFACAPAAVFCHPPPDGELPPSDWAIPGDVEFRVDETGRAEFNMQAARGVVASAWVEAGRIDWSWTIFGDDTGAPTPPDGTGRLIGRACERSIAGDFFDGYSWVHTIFYRDADGSVGHLD